MWNVILLPLLAVAGGIGGALLRRWELATAFDTDGLAIAWAPASLVLIALSVLLALVFALLSRGARHELKTCGDAFSASGSWLYLVAGALSAAYLLIAGLWGLREELLTGGGTHLLRLLLWVMCLISFFCVLSLVVRNFRGLGGGRYSLRLLMPAYTCCLWLVAAYQQRAADPVVLDYVYELFAIICSLLGLYFTAGFSFGRPRTWRCAFCCLLGVYFSLVTLADGHDWGTCALFLFSTLYQLSAVTALLYHAFVKGPAPSPDQPNKTQEVSPDE